MEGKTRARMSAAALVTVVLLVAGAGSANASVTKTGTRYCGTYELARSYGYSTGFTEHYPPGSGYKAFSNGSTWKSTDAFSSNGGGGFWFVETTGSLNDPKTYAVCTGIA